MKTTPETTTRKPHTARAAEPRTPFFERRERSIIIVLCALAALRILVYSAAFPVFTNIDEQLHFDTVCRYADFQLPRGVDPLCPEARAMAVAFGTTEYTAAMQDYAAARPLWTLPREDALPRFNYGMKAYENIANIEATQPPVYYAIGGIWYDAGKMLGLRGGILLHWLRSLNALVCALVVWLSYMFARRFFPTNSLVRLCVPLMVAFFPQDVFYCINNDVMCPLFFGAAFYCLLLVHLEPQRSLKFHAGAGLLVAAAFLVKYSNVAILAALAAVILTAFWSARRSRGLRAEVTRLALLALGAAAPIAAWLVRNRLVFGDFTGSGAEIAKLGWTLKPLTRVLDHPIFTPAGLITFSNELTARFWRGELVWHARPLSYVGTDLLYVATSVLFLTAALTALLIRRRKLGEAERASLELSAVVVAISVLFMMGLSIAYDFGGCMSPSRAHPFFTHGRRISGTLIPFLLLYVTGLDALLGRKRNLAIGFGILLLIACIATVSQVFLSLDALRSAYNLFHML